jgi:hypothetical protein
MEDPPRVQSASLDLGERNQRALRRYRNDAFHDRGVAPSK